MLPSVGLLSKFLQKLDQVEVGNQSQPPRQMAGTRFLQSSLLPPKLFTGRNVTECIPMQLSQFYRYNFICMHLFTQSIRHALWLKLGFVFWQLSQDLICRCPNYPMEKTGNSRGWNDGISFLIQYERCGQQVCWRSRDKHDIHSFLDDPIIFRL